MAERFFVPDPPAGLVRLVGEQAHHLVRVRRLGLGSQVTLFCGDGLDYPATVVAIQRAGVDLDVAAGQPNLRELSIRLLVAIPLPKADRGSFLVEKLTELGVTAIHLLQTQRTVMSPGETKVERLRRIAIEACKQCGRSVIPNISAPQKLSAFLAATTLPAARFLADPAGPPWPRAPLEDTVFLVGPEGGFDAEEREMAQAAGFRPVGLGPRILRVETAAIALAALRSTGE